MSLDKTEIVGNAFAANFTSICDDKFLTLLKKNIYVFERENIGHMVLKLKDFYPCNINKYNREIFIKYIICTTKESIAISKKYNKSTSITHLYLNNSSAKNFSLGFFKKINKILSERFEDTVETIYIYNNSTIFSYVWKVIRNFIDKDTRDRIVLQSH